MSDAAEPAAGAPEPAAAPPEPATPGAEAFLAAFDAFAQAIRRARGATPSPGALTLSFSQYGLVRGLATARRARVRELAADAGVAPSTATRILDALERRALVRRRADPDDRRGVIVELTADGQEALARQDGWLRGRQRAFYETLPVDEQALAPDLLERMAALIDELAAGPDSRH